MDALKCGDLGWIERAVHRAEVTNVTETLVLQGHAEISRLQAKAELFDAFKTDNARQLEVACWRAEKAGVDMILVSEGRSKISKIQENNELRRVQAEAELSE